MADAELALEEGFRAGLREALSQPELEALLERHGPDELYDMARRAGRLVAAPILWDRRLGPMLDTAEVSRELGITRQAVAKKVAAGQLLALPFGRTRRFPVWQFRWGPTVEVREEVAAALDAFQSVYPEVRPAQVAAWATTAQPELDGASPHEWLEAAQPLDPLLVAARRAAAALEQ